MHKAHIDAPARSTGHGTAGAKVLAGYVRWGKGNLTLQLQQILPASRILVVEARSPPMPNYRPIFAVCSPVSIFDSFGTPLISPLRPGVRARTARRSSTIFAVDIRLISYYLV